MRRACPAARSRRPARAAPALRRRPQSDRRSRARERDEHAFRRVRSSRERPCAWARARRSSREAVRWAKYGRSEHTSPRIEQGWARSSSWNRRTRPRSRPSVDGAVKEASPASGAAASIDRRRRPRRHKTALVLGGGGFTGGVYEIGALRALDLLAVNRRVNQFDVYVGTSAGAFIAALCANGVTPEEMMRVVTRQGPPPFKDIDLSDLLQPNLLELVRKGAALPLRTLALARQVRRSAARSVIDVLLGFAEGLPSGLYTGAGIERYLREVLSEPGRTDDFARARVRALPDGDRPRHVRARRLRRRRGLGRRADLDRGARVGRAADGLRAGARRRPRADRRRHRLDDQPRHRRRGRREARRRHQPDRAVRQRLRRQRAHAARHAPAARLGHGLPPDRLPGVQAASPTSACTNCAKTWEEPLPGRRHRADRARTDRRADVPDVDDELHLARRDRAPRLRVGHEAARRANTSTIRTSPSVTASTSPATACARSSSTSTASPRRRAPGARSSRARPARCCASPVWPADAGACAARRPRSLACEHATLPASLICLAPTPAGRVWRLTDWQSSALSIASKRRVVAAGLWIVMRTWCASPSASPAAT